MSSPPFRVTPYYRSLALSEDPARDPIAAQFVPQDAEASTRSYETADPLADTDHEVAPRVVHHYPDRILLLANDDCAMYCRHCFRRHFTGTGAGSISDTEIEGAADYVATHPEVREVLISGGDPLLLGPVRLGQLIDRITAVRSADPDPLLLRISTRIPVVAPDLISENLVAKLAGYRPLWMIIQANHPREITPEFRSAIARIVDAGIPVLNQAVLLRNVNDDVETLATLFGGLLRCRVKPYYLFQGDLAAGTAHFRTSIDKGLCLMDGLRARISGLAMPTYAVDLPRGAGKVPLTRGTVIGKEPGWYVIKNLDGTLARYPQE